MKGEGLESSLKNFFKLWFTRSESMPLFIKNAYHLPTLNIVHFFLFPKKIYFLDLTGEERFSSEWVKVGCPEVCVKCDYKNPSHFCQGVAFLGKLI